MYYKKGLTEWGTPYNFSTELQVPVTDLNKIRTYYTGNGIVINGVNGFCQASVYNFQGKLITTFIVNSDQFTKGITLTNGGYILKLDYTNKIHVEKIIVSN